MNDREKILAFLSEHGDSTPKQIADATGIFIVIIVPAQKEGFEKVFLGEDCWHAIRISGGMLEKIKYIAAYQSQPVSAITHYAPVDRIEPYGEGGKYKLVFSMKAKPIGPIPFGRVTTIFPEDGFLAGIMQQ